MSVTMFSLILATGLAYDSRIQNKTCICNAVKPQRLCMIPDIQVFDGKKVSYKKAIMLTDTEGDHKPGKISILCMGKKK